jgi:hypothetical protein
LLALLQCICNYTPAARERLFELFAGWLTNRLLEFIIQWGQYSNVSTVSNYQLFELENRRCGELMGKHLFPGIGFAEG